MKIKKVFASLLFGVVFGIGAGAQSISDAIRKFDLAMLNAQVSKGETVITSINYSDTNSSGSIVGWIQNEIKLAAAQSQIPRLTIVQPNSLLPEEQTAVIAATRGAPMKPRKASKKKFVLTGTYQQVEDNVEVYLFLKTEGGADFSSAKVLIPMSEVTKRKLTLYPQNVEQAKEVYKDVESSKKTAAKQEPEKTISVTAAMLDSENNVVDILHPGDVVNFVVNCDCDCYIAIMGIDANGNKYWLPIENPKMNANEARRFPDSDVEYTIVDGVFGAELLYVYAADSPSGLPKLTDDEKYQPNAIASTTRGFVATKKSGKKGVFAIPYTVISE